VLSPRTLPTSGDVSTVSSIKQESFQPAKTFFFGVLDFSARTDALKLAGSSFVYPTSVPDRARWIESYRGPKNPVDASRPHAFLHEKERGPDGDILPTATIFLTNRECPWRCVMCDLWRNTTDERVPGGAIPAQIRAALAQLPAARQIKLYNSGSFFDSRAIPTDDLPGIAQLVTGFERVVVECHPALVGEGVGEFQRLIRGRLEVAMGLETAHPGVLERLNKRMTLEMFRAATERLRAMAIDLRVFVLVKPPFMSEAEGVAWACRSIDFAIECGATVISLIPTRIGNGAMEELARQGVFAEPKLCTLEAAHDYGVGRAGARVFADLWDLRRFSKCAKCLEAREHRLHRMNLEQQVLPVIECACE